MLPVGRLGLYTLLVALPIAVEIPPDSSGANRGGTRITAIAGVGTYALIDRGCENQVIRTHPSDFRDAAASIEHEFPRGFMIGVRGGAMEEDRETTTLVNEPPSYQTVEVAVRSEASNAYINPHVGIEAMNAGLGVGWIWAREPFASRESFEPGPSFHVRFGRRDATHVVLSYMENMPIHSGGGGYGEIAIGVHPHRLIDFAVAVGSVPYDGLGLGLRFDYRVLPNWSLLGRARLGHSGGEPQSGAALGLAYTTRRPVPPRHKERHPGDIGWRGGLEAKPPKGSTPVTPAPTAPAAASVTAAAALPHDDKIPKYEDFQSLDSLAVPVLRAEPVAPDSATGTVSVAALVDWNGNVVETRVIKSIPALDAAAIECASRWTFRPAIHQGRRVASWVTIPVRFRKE